MENKELISKWLNDELTGRELAAFKKTQDYQAYKDIVENATRFKRPVFDEQRELDRLKAKMASANDRPVKKLHSSSFFKIAAVLVVLIATGLFFLLNAPKTISTGYSEMASMELPDESKVHLNAETRIKFRPSKWAKQRKLSLQGEAYFEVEKGKKFTVETEQGLISVLGTKFNVNSRPGYFEVQCYEGAVKVIIENKELILKKGRSFKMIKGKSAGVHDFKQALPGWTYHESEFDAVPLEQVVAELERQFGIRIETKGIDLKQLFTGSFSHTNKEVALQAVTMPLQLKYRFETDDKVLLYEE